MDAILQKLIENNFSDLKGLAVHASIPVPEPLINEVVETALKGNRNITDCQVSVSGQNRISMYLKTTLLPWPLNLKLRLDKAVDLGNSPKIMAFLENNLLLGAIGSLFKGLPAGINISGNQIIVDVGAFLRKPEQKRFFDLIKSAEITTEEGKVILDVKFTVDP